MNIKVCVATAALFASALTLSLPAMAADSAGGATPAGQAKPAAQPPPPTAKAADKAAMTVPADCAKLTDPKSKDDCVKKAQAATSAATGAGSGTTTGSTTKPATGGASKY